MFGSVVKRASRAQGGDSRVGWSDDLAQAVVAGDETGARLNGGTMASDSERVRAGRSDAVIGGSSEAG